MKPIVSLVCAADINYSPHMAAMLHSVVTHTRDADVAFYFLHSQQFPDSELERLAAFCVGNAIGFHAVLVERERLPQLPSSAKYCEEAWYRLLLPSLLPSLDKVLWLDADLLLRRSVLELWQVTLKDCCVAAVPNAMSKQHWLHHSRLGMEGDRAAYFNTGVMLLNLAQMRLEDAEAQMCGLLSRIADQVIFADQDVFNPLYYKRYQALDVQWNVTAGVYFFVGENIRIHGKSAVVRALANPYVVHFTRQKPWQYASAHPYRKLYLKHRKAAGWGRPVYLDKTLMGLFKRHVPLIVKSVMGRLRHRQFGDLGVLLAGYLRSLSR